MYSDKFYSVLYLARASDEGLESAMVQRSKLIMRV